MKTQSKDENGTHDFYSCLNQSPGEGQFSLKEHFKQRKGRGAIPTKIWVCGKVELTPKTSTDIVSVMPQPYFKSNNSAN